MSPAPYWRLILLPKRKTIGHNWPLTASRLPNIISLSLQTFPTKQTTDCFCRQYGQPLCPSVSNDQIRQHSSPVDLPTLSLWSSLDDLGMHILQVAFVSALHTGCLRYRRTLLGQDSVWFVREMRLLLPHHAGPLGHTSMIAGWAGWYAERANAIGWTCKPFSEDAHSYSYTERQGSSFILSRVAQSYIDKTGNEK